MKYEVSMSTKTPALSETPHQNLCALPGFLSAQSSRGCNKHRERQEKTLRKLEEGIGPDYVDDSSLSTNFL